MIDSINSEEIKSNVLQPNQWQRLIFMLLFTLLLQVASIMMWVLVPLQFIFALFTGHDNSNLRSLGHSISSYIFEILQFLSYNSESKPFPFSERPNQDKSDNTETAVIIDQKSDDSSAE